MKTISLQKTKQLFQKKLVSDDIVFYDFSYPNIKGFLIYVDSITDRTSLGELVLKPLSIMLKTDKNIEEKIFNAKTTTCDTIQSGIEQILNGFTLVVTNPNSFIAVDLKKFDVRAISEPPTSVVVKGPREGFNESIKTNLSLIRRRVKTPDLVVENLSFGEQSKTSICILYMKNIANMEIIKLLKSRLNSTKIDNIPDSSYIAKIISDKKYSLIKQVGTTEKPDILIAKMMEGRVGIIVDGSPITLTIPYLILEDFQNSEDYFKNDYTANIERVLRFLAIAVSILLPGIFVSVQVFHLDFIPIKFLLTIVNAIKGIPLSPVYEMFFTLIIFETLNEASIRMPKYIGLALSIVGALVLGETAVSAGIVSSPTIMIMALSGIGLYTVPDIIEQTSLLRFVVLIIGGIFGGFGILLSIAFVLCYLSGLESFGVPILSPFAPLNLKDFQDGIIMDNVLNMKKRPISLNNIKNKIRIKNNENS